ncbi:Na+/H+ antiporter NhaC [Moraxella bovis]|uniref:Na+/H+ antiporter NhaC family protein n=1 Tax=Moraxella bovis TaxID=476 RepID=UPI002226A563|nr:Na+/H+ antiporter NhaC family protein [Moraxella bovis]UYZ67861.1 Na+/H+ antiporter NhaC [Moraxella bovis]UYZ70236.1 Na+/H+ antiporter NhaC [Moraxella bovis]UYZ73855.1 Na+/H+ antiporter NhaC [Moraxella bovis]UZA13534.1 Na+/H+ antiporter NhaC [Moraxella bovis]UZA28110.1 Na+/H+ antiporter NhaC [Moraxella bovis]
MTDKHIHHSHHDDTLLTLSHTQAVVIAISAIIILGVTMIAWGFVPHLSLLLVILGLLMFGFSRRIAFDDMQERMIKGVSTGMGAIYLFSFIGLLVSALMMSGAIPTLIYYGFNVLSPQMFYLSAFILASVIGVALGSGFTTCATVGVAFLGMTEAFNANPAIVAGAVVSGALFGDKMSPLSDTTSIAASIVGIDLFDHIKNMMYTTIPAWLISAVVFFVLSGDGGADLADVAVLQDSLVASGLVHGYALIPFVVLIALAVMRVNAIYAISATIAVSLIITYIHSSPSLAELGGWFFTGYKPAEGLELGNVGRLVSRGGLESMFFSQLLVILALSLGGLLHALGVLPALLSAIRHLLTRASRAVLTASLTAFGVNFLVGEQYLSLLLSGNTFAPEFKRLGLHPKNLARTIEDSGTVINPLVPWGVYGVFLTGVFGMPVLDYVPYAVFCYGCLFLTLFFGFTGITITRVEPTQET